MSAEPIMEPVMTQVDPIDLLSAFRPASSSSAPFVRSDATTVRTGTFRNVVQPSSSPSVTPGTHR
ncbi:hypothetical protein ACWC2M_14800 [Streptomyces sp. NPDC001761]